MICPSQELETLLLAIFLAGICACAFLIIGLSTTLSATIQLILTIVGVSFLIISVATICHIEPPLGHAFVIRKREGLRVVRGSTYLPFWQKIYPIQLVTSKMIEINFNQAPYPKTLDGLPVRVKVQANLTFDDSDEALIAAVQIQGTIGQEKHYDDLKKDLEGIISKVLSERNYKEHIEKRNEFEKSVNEYWQSITKLHSLHRINVEIEPVKLEDAELSEVDFSKATSTVVAIKADEDKSQLESKKKIEENKREKAKEESQTAIIISEEKEKEAESKNANQHKSNMNESKREDARDKDKFENELSRLSREEQRVNKEIEIEKAKQELSLKKADANRKVQIAEANTKLEVEWIKQ